MKLFHYDNLYSYLMLENGRHVEGHRESENRGDVDEGLAQREPHVRRLGPGKVAIQGQVPLHGCRLRIRCLQIPTNLTSE